MSSTEELIGRANVDDIEAILAVTNTDVDEVAHAVHADADAIFTWDYEQSRKPLQRLYEKAKTSQWNASTDLPWQTDVDQEGIARRAYEEGGRGPLATAFLEGTQLEKWGEREWVSLNMEYQNWMLSQFMHGEQGALLCSPHPPVSLGDEAAVRAYTAAFIVPALTGASSDPPSRR